MRPGAAVEPVAPGQDVELADHRQAHRLLDGFVLVGAEGLRREGLEAPAPSRLRHRGEGGDDRGECGLVLDGGREVLLGSAASDAVTEGVGTVIGRIVGSEGVEHGRLFLRSSVTQDTGVDAGNSR